MTKPKIDNLPYKHTVSVLNRALPLEYAIRAFKVAEPEIFSALEALDEEIESYWLDLGWARENMVESDLKDLSWDALQCGYPMVRNHLKLYTHADEMRIALDKLSGEFVHRFNELECDFLYRFRACDLLSGNDIRKLLAMTEKSLRYALNAEAKGEFDAEYFLRGVREVRHLYPTAVMTNGKVDTKWGIGQQALWLGLPFDLTLDDLKGVLNEYLYQYARQREFLTEEPDNVPGLLVQGTLLDELFKQPQDAPVTTLRSLTAPLRGLLCWDYNREYAAAKVGNFRTKAIKKAARICRHMSGKTLTQVEGILLNDLRAAHAKIADVRPSLLPFPELRACAIPPLAKPRDSCA